MKFTFMKGNNRLMTTSVFFRHLNFPLYTPFSVLATLFSTSASVFWTFSWTEFQMFLRCCLIHKSIIILRHFLCLFYLCPCLDLGLFTVSHLCNPFFIFIFIFVMISHIISWIPTYMFFCWSFRICLIIFGW